MEFTGNVFRFAYNMAKKKKKEIVKEIRIGRPSKGVYEKVEMLAERENRTIAAQANYMILKYIEQHKL